MKEKLVKILWTMLILILMLAIVPTVQAANENKIGEKNWYGIIGDVNGDKKINSADANLILKYSVGEKRLTLFQRKRADVNQDGEINSNDSLRIMEYATQATTKPSNNKVNVSKISITGKEKMYVGETTKLSVKIEPSNATNKEVKWSSNSSAKATVDANGNVTAKKAGKVKITAKVDGQTQIHEIEIVERKDKKLEDLGKVKITTITTKKPAELHVNSRNDAWIVNNCVNETEVTKTYKINASKDYVSSGAISLFLANKILGKTGDSIKNYQVKEDGKYVAWRTDWAKGNYTRQDFENFEQQMNKICYEIYMGNPVAIPVNDENGNFRYVLAYAMTIPTQANPQFDAENIYVIDPTIGGYRNLSDYYEFIEGGKVVYRVAYLSRTAVKRMTLNSSAITIDKGKAATLTPKFYNKNEEITIAKLKVVKSWTSSNTKVATVKNGKVTAVGKGTATITAVSRYPDDGSVKATCKITVKETTITGKNIIDSAKKMWIHTKDVGGYSYDFNYTTTDVTKMWNNHKMCCASYVAWVLYDSGIMTANQINNDNFNGANAICNKLYETGKFTKTYLSSASKNNLKKGDIVLWSGSHVQIYDENGWWYNGGSQMDTSDTCQHTEWYPNGSCYVYRLK